MYVTVKQGGYVSVIHYCTEWKKYGSQSLRIEKSTENKASGECVGTFGTFHFANIVKMKVFFFNDQICCLPEGLTLFCTHFPQHFLCDPYIFLGIFERHAYDRQRVEDFLSCHVMSLFYEPSEEQLRTCISEWKQAARTSLTFEDRDSLSQNDDLGARGRTRFMVHGKAANYILRQKLYFSMYLCCQKWKRTDFSLSLNCHILNNVSTLTFPKTCLTKYSLIFVKLLGVSHLV